MPTQAWFGIELRDRLSPQASWFAGYGLNQMAERSQSSVKKRRATGGDGVKANGNGRPSGTGNGRHANGNGNGHGRANGNGRLNGNGHEGNGVATVAEVRRIATEMGNAMLATTSVDTARHSDDVELITDAIAQKFDFSESERSDLRAGARLHDIGKAAVPPEILTKPGPLDAEEWDVMLQHTIIGEQILGSVNELGGIAKLVRHSHERWDGDGYPDGLAGEDIPLGSRIIFCADAFHAVRSNRPYREGRSASQALTEIRRCSGTQFDPEVVAALEAVVRELQIIGPGRRSYRSSRLTALLLVLAVGGGGSAVAGSQLLGGDDSTGDTAGSATPAHGGVLGISAGSSKAADGNAGGGSAGKAASRGSDGSGRAGSGSVSSSQSSAENLNSDGGGGDAGGSSSGGSNDQANPDSWAGGGSPGQSGNAPGHGGSNPGNSGNAPGQQPTGPGNSANAPGQQPTGPGNSANAPGHQSAGPGNSANAPGHQAGS